MRSPTKREAIPPYAGKSSNSFEDGASVVIEAGPRSSPQVFERHFREPLRDLEELVRHVGGFDREEICYLVMGERSERRAHGLHADGQAPFPPGFIEERRQDAISSLVSEFQRESSFQTNDQGELTAVLEQAEVLKAARRVLDL